MTWRAKEILQGTIGSSKYDPLLYEQYGLVLLQMNDLVEAGKYLFLSGQVKEEYREALTLYLEKFGRSDWQTLVASFPKRAKNIKLELFPADVRAKLRELEIPDNRGNELPMEELSGQIFGDYKGSSDTLFLVGCGCASLLIVAWFLAGLAFIVQTYQHFFR